MGPSLKHPHRSRLRPHSAKHSCLLIVVFSLAFASACLNAQTNFVSGIYQIISGSYSACCGIAGPTVTALPTDDQKFIRLTVDPQTTLATMSFLGRDQTTVFSVNPCPTGYPAQFNFWNGFLFSDRIIFHVDPGPPPYSEYWSFIVSNSPAGLRVDGTVGFANQICADVPTQFTYSNLVAVLMPSAEIRISQVEICWNSVSNTMYQVQYQQALTTNDWVNLGPPVSGNGFKNCVTDPVAQGQTQRVYRVVPVP